MAAKPEMLGPASLAIGQSVGAFISFLPKFSEVRRGSDDAIRKDVRMGEVAATTLCVGIGIIVSSLVGNGIPFYVSVMTAVILISLYESALRMES